MKNLKPFFIILFVFFACVEESGLTYLPPPPPPTGGGTGGGINIGSTVLTLKKITFSTLLTDVSTVYSNIKINPDAVISTYSDGTRYADFSLLNNLPANQLYLKNLNFIEPPADYIPLSKEEFKAYVGDKLIELGLSSYFNNSLLITLDYIHDIDNLNSFSEFESNFNGRLSSVSNSTSLTEMEKFILTQAYSSTLAHVKYAYSNPTNQTTSAGAPCLPQTKEEWKAVAETAFMTGLGTGIGYGITGAKAGAVATTAAGNPAVGAIVGGGIGFVTGFIGGAFLGGGGRLMFECLWKKAVGGKMMTFQCGDRIYQAYTASPPTGCTETASLITNAASITSAVKLTLKDIYNVGLVPNSGNTSIATTVNADIKSLISYLN